MAERPKRYREDPLAAARRRLTAWRQELAHPQAGLRRDATEEVVRQLEEEIEWLERARQRGAPDA